MRRIHWVVMPLCCLIFLFQARAVLCQDQIIAGQGETIPNLQIGLKNTGWTSYEAYAEASGDAGYWVSPSTIWFGLIQPGEAKTATYTLIIPKDASPSTYYIYWRFYARSGAYTQYLFTSTVRVTVLISSRDPAKLLPLWLFVGIVTLSPLWYWTRRREITISIPETMISRPDRRFRRLAASAVIVAALSLSVFYTWWYVPFLPVVVTDTRTATCTTTRSSVVTTDMYLVRTTSTISLSTSTRMAKEEEDIIVLSVTAWTTLTQRYTTYTTLLLTDFITVTTSVEATRHKTLADTYPMLHLLLAAVIIAISVVMFGRGLRTPPADCEYDPTDSEAL